MRRINITLRSRIFFSMILIILVSLFLTGAFSFFHFKKENRLYHEHRLRRKEKTINESIDYFLNQQPISPYEDSIVKRFDEKICELANVHNMHINIYSLSGDIIITSNPHVFEERMMAPELGQSVLEELRKRPKDFMVWHNGPTGEYMSTFDFIYNRKNQPVAIVNLPYFQTEEYHRNDLKEFLTQLLWIYLLLFVVSILLAYFLSNYITGSFNAIRQKLKNVKIGEPNPPLRWKYNDEVGTLIGEYNRMLDELEKSAVKLAQTERESAWKEMAKQVAHEIKNPLTPMRLSVQHLERSLQTDEPHKLKEFTQSMIGQIDTLSSIAEAFSRFANMPALKMERFPAREIIHRVTSLYPTTNISFETENENAKIYGDKEQLIRVMNNLINNAIQAVPEEKEPEIKVCMENQGDELLIAVQDNGVGIPEDQGNRIFEPRFTTKTKGMGLGLAMVKNIVNGFNGRIWYESTVGKGSTFYISLPLA